MKSDERRAEIQALSDTARDQLIQRITGGEKLSVVKAPPGSGKTYLLLTAAIACRKKRMRVAVATQTNTQADDICRRIARDYPMVLATRFASKSAEPLDLGKNIEWQADNDGLPSGPSIVIGTAAKWAFANVLEPFDILFIEEAWQLKWVDFMLLAAISGNFVLIGDPGQIPPTVTIPTSRWETSPRAPHMAAPEVILSDGRITSFALSLPATRRLPYDTTELIKPFYPFDFTSVAGPGDRVIRSPKNGKDAVDEAIRLLASGTAVGLTLPTPDGGPPLEDDSEIAQAAVNFAIRLLDREAAAIVDGSESRLKPEEIGLCATHHVMNAAMERLLPVKVKGKLEVETPERWQGLERKVMIAVHPLSGVLEPSSFDLETGRLCVMASRHKAGLIVVSRDHISDTLRGTLPAADQAVGRPDVSGRGHERNIGFWGALEGAGRVVAEKT